MLSGVVTDIGVGGTFLSWSLHFLSGDNSYFRTKDNKSYQLVDNPIREVNAHNFLSNFAADTKSFNEMFSCLHQRNDHNVIYFHTWSDENELHGVNTLKENNIKTIGVLNPRANILHLFVDDVRTGPGRRFCDNFAEKYFSSARKLWQEQNLNEIWDRREFLALNILVEPISNIQKTINESKIDYYHLNTSVLWNYLDNKIEDVLDYMELKLVVSRFDHWKQVYQQWRQIHFYSQQFMWDFPFIIHNILNGVNHDLSQYNLDIVQEAVIQRELIRNHNLNLKTFQLEKFENTLQLHNLLETNCHEVN